MSYSMHYTLSFALILNLYTYKVIFISTLIFLNQSAPTFLTTDGLCSHSISKSVIKVVC